MPCLRLCSIAHIFAIFCVVCFLSCAKEAPPTGKGAAIEFDYCVRLATQKKYDDAIQCLESVKSRYPGSQEGQEAELKIGDAYFNKKEYLLAAESYAAFLKLYPHSPQADYAHFRAGVSYYKEAPKAIDRDQDYLDDAIDHLSKAVTRYPKSAYRDLASKTLYAARLRVARRHYYVGRFYYRTGEYLASIPRLQAVVDGYAETGLAPKSLFLITMGHLKLGNFEAAKDAFGKLATNYAGTKWSHKAERELLKSQKKKERKGAHAIRQRVDPTWKAGI